MVIAALLVLGVILLDMIWDETDDQAAPSLAPTASVAPSPTASETLEPPTLPPAAPTGIQAEAAAFEVLVTWEPGTGEGADPAAYQISRDGELLETVGVDELSFRDADVLPATSYEYEVAAVDADGVTSAEVATVSAETESVPLSAARLSGTFDMGLKETSHFGYDTFGTAPTEQRWRFVPKCGRGPCAVKFSAEGVRDSSTQLARAAGSYEGSYRSTAFVSCAGVPSTTAVSIRFEVTRAAVVDGEWRATKIAGSLVHREAPQLSCVASGTDFTVAGTLVQG